MVVSIILAILLIGLLNSPESLYKSVVGLIILAVGVCTLGLSFRRFHDVGLSGWLVFLNIVPFFGGIFVFVVTLLPSKGPNKYGYGPWRPNP
jgi:uncharacterized membrane protein YhaH (DUF805 family)